MSLRSASMLTRKLNLNDVIRCTGERRCTLNPAHPRGVGIVRQFGDASSGAGEKGKKKKKDVRLSFAGGAGGRSGGERISAPTPPRSTSDAPAKPSYNSREDRLAGGSGGGAGGAGARTGARTPRRSTSDSAVKSPLSSREGKFPGQMLDRLTTERYNEERKLWLAEMRRNTANSASERVQVSTQPRHLPTAPMQQSNDAIYLLPVVAPFTVLYDFEATKEDELTIKAGEHVTFVYGSSDDGSGWSEVVRLRDGATGIVPTNYVGGASEDAKFAVYEPGQCACNVNARGT